MPSPECKVYFDGSHYIAIPHTTRPYRPRKKRHEEKITVKPPDASEESNEESEKADTMSETSPSETDETGQELTPLEQLAEQGTPISSAPSPPAISTPSGILNENGDVRFMTRRELFNEVYKECVFLRFKERKARLLKAMRPYFKTDEATKNYVESNLERKRRNLIARRIRLTRKANLQDFNYFVTLTYDGAKHTEESFRKKLKSCLGHFVQEKSGDISAFGNVLPKSSGCIFMGSFVSPKAQCRGI